ncbi:MAG: ornithine cyclodeaminase family protein [Chloroflexi bacterium]|nr:ornithine cyclodeaminase family protein [Chloroflexota bacterium]
MAIFLRDDDVIRLLPMSEAVEVVEQGFKEQGNGTGINLPRERAQAGEMGVTMMVAVLGGQGVGGFKALGAGKPLVLLYGGEPRQLLAVMEAGSLGQIRTGAASGVATRYMAREDASTVGIIGTGFQARSQLAAVCAVRPIQAIKAYSRTPERREEFCRTMSDSLGIQVSPVSSAQEAVQGTDIAIAVTNVRTLDPVLLGDWLEPGMHINAAGANSLARRELDDAAVMRCSIIAADAVDQAKLECADLVIPIDSGLLGWNTVLELGQVVTGRASGRAAANDITLFESQGIALEDVAVAAHIFERAKAEGTGEALPF